MTTYNNVKTSLDNSHSLIKRSIIIWLDIDINHANETITNSFNTIQSIVDSIEIFININECIQYIDTIKNEEIFLIIIDSFDQQHIRLINLIEETNQINSVYINSNDLSKEIIWKNECKKFQGIFPDIKHICNILEENIYSLKSNPSTTSIISSIDADQNELDQTFMYSKLLIDIIYKIEYDENLKNQSFDFCREQYIDNNTQLKIIDEFKENYYKNSPIWWYTKDSPAYLLIRDAFLTQNINVLIQMGFFIKDLHQAIKKIHSEKNLTIKFTVYRGQGMLNIDFEDFRKQKGSLYAFHNFTSTSTDQEVSLHFAKCALVDLKKVGILFEMEIDPLICSIPFASVNNTSYFLEAENEILFSTHTVFRIGEFNQIDDRLWKVNLILTRDIDQQMIYFVKYIRNEIYGLTNWHSLAILLYKMGIYDKAIEIFNRIMEITNENDNDKFMITLASIYNNFGLIYDSMENYSNALAWYEKALEIQQKILSSDHPSLATVNNNIGMIYRSMGNYPQALLYCEKTLEIRLKSSSLNHKSLTTVYSNIGMIYEAQGDYKNALLYYKKAFELQKCSYPLYHPELCLSYNNFGGIYCLMGNYSTALSYYEKTFQIQEKFLPSDHPSMAIICNNIGHVYQLMGHYLTSISYYEEALIIKEKFGSPNQLSLAVTYNNIGLVYRLKENYSTALSYYNKALEIEEKSLSSNHPSLASTYNNLAAVYQSMEEYTTALSYYEKTLEIWQKSLPSNHSSLATIFNNIGSVYDSMGDYKQALSYYEKTIEIQQQLPLKNHLELASTYNNIGEVYRSMEDYPKALSYYQKTLEIEQKILSNKHPSLATTVNNMAIAFDANNQYDKALEYAEQAFDIFCHVFGPNHSQTKQSQIYLNQLRQKLLPTT